MRVSGLRLEFGLDGSLIPSSSFKLDTRFELWRYWLAEAVSAAVDAADAAAGLSAEVLESDSDKAARLIANELRVSMRAMTSAAFAIDAFYSSVKARSPEHPQQAAWKAKPPRRHQQVADTLRHHLRITKNDQSRELSKRVKEIFKFRDWAVHPGSRFTTPAYRDDLGVSVDWHFVAFRASNAVAGVGKTVELLDFLVAVLDRGSDELVEWKPHARRMMDQILDSYEATDKLRPIVRVEPEATGAQADGGQ